MNTSLRSAQATSRYQKLVAAKDALYASLFRIEALLPVESAKQVVEQALVETGFTALLKEANK